MLLFETYPTLRFRTLAGGEQSTLAIGATALRIKETGVIALSMALVMMTYFHR